MSENDRRYPIGGYKRESGIDAARVTELIGEIATLPRRLREVTADLTAEQWEQPYREGGWTVRQVVHHIADSHLNAYLRFRLALTEDTPTIKPYDQEKWAELPDVIVTPPEVSIVLTEAIHRRWTDMLRGLPAAALRRELYHPEQDRNIPLEEMLGLYAWHGRHHVAQIESVGSGAALEAPGRQPAG